MEDDPSASLLRPGVVVGDSPGAFRRLASSESMLPNSAVYGGQIGDRIWLDSEEPHLFPNSLRVMTGCFEMLAVSFLLAAGTYLLVTQHELLLRTDCEANDWMCACGPVILITLCTDLIMYSTCGVVTLALGLVCGNGSSSFSQASGFISVSVFAFSSIVWTVLLVVGSRLLALHWTSLQKQRLLLAWLAMETLMSGVYVVQALPFFVGIFKYLGHKLLHKIHRQPLVSWNYGEGQPSWFWVTDFQNRYPAEVMELGLLHSDAANDANFM